MSLPQFDWPDDQPGQLYAQSRLLDGGFVVVTPHWEQEFTATLLNGAINVVGYLVSSVQTVEVQGYATLYGTVDQVSGPAQLGSSSGGTGLWVPIYNVVNGGTLIIRNPGDVDATVQVFPVEILNGDFAALTPRPAVRSTSDPTLGAGETLGPFWVPQAGLYESVDVLVVSDQACTVKATWAFVAGDLGGIRRFEAVETLGTTVGAGNVHAVAPMRGTSVEISVTNDDAMDPADVAVLVRLS